MVYGLCFQYEWREDVKSVRCLQASPPAFRLALRQHNALVLAINLRRKRAQLNCKRSPWLQLNPFLNLGSLDPSCSCYALCVRGEKQNTGLSLFALDHSFFADVYICTGCEGYGGKITLPLRKFRDL